MDEIKKRRIINIARVSMKLIKRAQQIGEVISEMDNPFIGKPRARVQDIREKFVTDFAAYLQQKALATVESGELNSTLFLSEENIEWLFEEIDKILQIETWDAPHIARLASLCFYVLTSGSEEEEPENDL